MAVECFEGFDTFTTAQVLRRYPYASPVFITSPGRYGIGQCLTLQFNNPPQVPFIVTPRMEYYVGFDLYVTQYGNAILNFTNTSNAIIGTIASGALGIVTTPWGTSGLSVIPLNTWCNLQCHIVISATVGVVTIKIDGVVILNVTNVDTGALNIGSIVLISTTIINSAQTYDNFWVLNTLGTHSNTFPVGAMTVQPLYPSADATPLQWTPLSGTTHYTEVDELVCDDDTSYNYAMTIGSKDMYDIGSLTGTISQVHAVQVSGVVRKDAVPSKSVQLIANSGGTVVESSIFVPENYANISILLDDDPNTSAQWTVTDVNALEIGAQVLG